MTAEQERELHSKISAWFEPKPANKQDDGFWDNLMASEGTGHHYMSNLGYWRFKLSGYQRGDEIIAVPLDFTHDEAANAKLLDAMPEVGLFHEHDKWVCCLIWNRTDKCEHLDRKAAVRDAFCRFAGISIES